MKKLANKEAKKLILSKETLSVLSEERLERVRGGLDGTSIMMSQNPICPQSEANGCTGRSCVVC